MLQKTLSNRRLPEFQKIGVIVRVHWDYVESERDGDVVWECWELVLPAEYTQEQAAKQGLPPDLAARFNSVNFVEEPNE